MADGLFTAFDITNRPINEDSLFTSSVNTLIGTALASGVGQLNYADTPVTHSSPGALAINANTNSSTTVVATANITSITFTGGPAVNETQVHLIRITASGAARDVTINSASATYQDAEPITVAQDTTLVLTAFTNGTGGVWDVSTFDSALYAAASHTHVSTDITDSTVAGRTLLTAANAAAQRTALNVEDGATADQTGAEIASTIDIQNTTDRSAFSTGDKLLIWEAGVGNRRIDFSDLPGAGGGLANVVEDITPQLGGDLDMNGNNITAAGPTTISPTEVSYLDGVTSNLQTQINARGDFTGPASSTDNAILRFDGTSGKLGQNSVVTIADTSGNMAGVGTINTHTIPAGTSTFVTEGAAQTLASKTLTTPTIASFTNATHNHSNAAGGGQLSITGATTGTLSVARGGTNLTTVAANTVLQATTTDVITATAMAASTIHARRATGNVGAITYANIKADLGAIAQTVNAQTGTTFTPALTDVGTHALVTLNNAAAVTVTIDTTSIAFTSGMVMNFLNLGAGSVTFQGGGGLTLNVKATQTLTLPQYGAASVIFQSDTSAVLVGGMTAV